MKILLVSNMYPSAKDTLFGVFVKNFVHQLQAKGVSFEISVVKGKSGGSFRKGLKYISFYIRTFIKGITTRYDLIYVHFASHCAPVILLLKFFRPKIKVVVNVHGSDVLGKKSALKTFVTRSVLRKAEGIVTPSSYFKKVVAETFGQSLAGKTFVYPSGGINTSIFAPKAGTKLPNNAFRIGFAARIIEEKGWKDFVHALHRLEISSDSLFEAIMVGKGPDEEQLRKEIKALTFKNNVSFRGLVTQSELAEMYNEIDVFVFASKREEESLGLVGVEAMACGTPVIGSNMAGIVTYVKDKHNGFLFAPGNVEDLANKLLDFSRLSNEAKAYFKKNALATAKEYDSEKVTSELMQWLNKIAHGEKID